MSLFLYLSGISLGRYFWENLAKSGELGKNIKMVNGHIGGGLPIEGCVFKPSAYYAVICYHILNSFELLETVTRRLGFIYIDINLLLYCSYG